MKKLLPFVFVAALAGCDLEAAAEADRVCVTQADPAQRIPAAPPIVVPENPLFVPIAFDLGGAIPSDLGENGITAEVIARSLTLSGADLSGVATAKVLVAKDGGAAVELATYARPAGATGVTAIEFTTAPVDLAGYLQGDRVSLQFNFSGSPPQQAWSPTIRTCASSKVKVDYVKAAGL